MTSKEIYALLDKLNLCHRCQKSLQLPNRKFCADCIEKIAEYNAKKYDPKKAHEYQARRREIYRQKKEDGICIRCTKPATHGLFCYEHFIQAKRRNRESAERRKRERHERGLIPEYREINNLCLRCGNPIDVNNSKLCSVCCEENKKNSALADKSKWRKDEQVRFEKNKIWRSNHEY